MVDEANAGPEEVTLLLRRLRAGERGAEEDLYAVVYEPLRRIAQRIMGRERTGHTLDPTALVHEAYVRLIGQEEAVESRPHFLAVAARAMRFILVDHARAWRTDKRRGERRVAGGADDVVLDGVVAHLEASVPDVVMFDDAVAKLTDLDEELGRVVEMRFFGGMSEPEIAEALGVSTRTVQRAWATARAWLRNHLGDAP